MIRNSLFMTQSPFRSCYDAHFCIIQSGASKCHPNMTNRFFGSALYCIAKQPQFKNIIVRQRVLLLRGITITIMQYKVILFFRKLGDASCRRWYFAAKQHTFETTFLLEKGFPSIQNFLDTENAQCESRRAPFFI